MSVGIVPYEDSYENFKFPNRLSEIRDEKGNGVKSDRWQRIDFPAAYL